MIGEAYYPEYEKIATTTTTTTNMGNGMTSTRTHTSYTYHFIGYRYTHAVIAVFDKNGEMLWDNCFEIGDVLTYNLREKVKVMNDGDNIVLAYSEGGYIKYKIIKDNEVVQGKDEVKIETLKEDDNVKRNSNSDLDFWYDNYFLVWGFQKIKNDNKESKGKRTVFYFNKIGLQ